MSDVATDPEVLASHAHARLTVHGQHNHLEVCQRSARVSTSSPGPAQPAPAGPRWSPVSPAWAGSPARRPADRPAAHGHRLKASLQMPRAAAVGVAGRPGADRATPYRSARPGRRVPPGRSWTARRDRRGTLNHPGFACRQELTAQRPVAQVVALAPSVVAART